MKVIFAGGGSGGHIFPAIAIADEMKKMDSKTEILFIGAKGRLEEKIVPQNNYSIELINISGLDRTNFRKNLLLPAKFLNALRKSRNIIKNFKPNAVVGTGGFVSGPVVYMAQRMKIPVLLQEGNAFPGKVTKALSKKATAVVINFEESARHLKRKNNILKISHPVRCSLAKIDRVEALKQLGLNAKNKTIFIFGGSQGARGINEAVEKILPRLLGKNINVIWQTGKSDFERLNNKFTGNKGRLQMPEFIADMAAAYSAADLVISRAGITSIMEMAYLGIAALLIPLPTSAENHQELNARNLYAENAALMLLQSGLNEKLYDTILDTLNNEALLESLRKNIQRFSDPDAAKKIAEEIYKLAG